ncbi:MAG: hypothetical protein EPO68_10145 [Planctomycetota bacterium]|nr:MAG: hypothetical protein EPO68_10145 [Planctomycetota bacterium]
MSPRRSLVLVAALLAAASAWFLREPLRRAVHPLTLAMGARATIDERVAEYGPGAHARLAPDLERVALTWPPQSLVLVGLKRERELRVFANDGSGARLLRTYPVLAASGASGPKLREGDRQVPEGEYGIEALNPNSRFHLALRVAYPNAADLEQAHIDGRTELGSDIMIHGGSASIGCLALGDEAIEELFVLAAATGIERVRVLLCPHDLRVAAPPAEVVAAQPWMAARYAELASRLRELPDR